MPLRRLYPREIHDLTDTMEERISEMIKAQIEEVKASLGSEMELMKSDIFAKVVSALGGIPRHVGIEGSYDEATEDFEIVDEDKIDREERSIGIRASQFAKRRSQLKLKHKIEVSNFSGTLNPKDLID